MSSVNMMMSHRPSCIERLKWGRGSSFPGLHSASGTSGASRSCRKPSSDTLRRRNSLPPTGCIPSPSSRRRLVLKASALEELEQAKDDGEQGTSAQYEAAILEVTNPEQWMTCLELLTEVRLLKLSVAGDVMEQAVLTLAEVRQGKKAAEILQAQIKAGATVSSGTVIAVMQTLARETEYKAAESLMAVASDGITAELAPAYNCLVRTYARADQVEAARSLFGDLFSADLAEGDTYTSLASMYMRSGDADEADCMLELRG